LVFMVFFFFLTWGFFFFRLDVSFFLFLFLVSGVVLNRINLISDAVVKHYKFSLISKFKLFIAAK